MDRKLIRNITLKNIHLREDLLKIINFIIYKCDTVPEDRIEKDGDRKVTSLLKKYFVLTFAKKHLKI